MSCDVKVPQQPNGCDCGYYVMAYCKHLIDGAIHGVEDCDMKWVGIPLISPIASSQYLHVESCVF